MQELLSFANGLGFSPPSFELDGKIHRFNRNGKRNAWYIGYQCFLSTTGESFLICILGDWKTGEKHEYKPRAKKYNKEDRDSINRKLADAAAKAEEERKLLQDDARHKAEKLISVSRPIAKGCEYLERKKIDLCGAVTVMDQTHGKTVIVPMRDTDGKLWGAQRIFPNGEKRFITGQRIKETFFVMGDPDLGFAYLCEGFATGASVHMATGKTVFVAFNAGNLIDVGRAVRKRWTNKTIVVCGDDDHHNEENIGRIKAEEAAKVCMGSAIFPQFVDKSDKSDFNDLHCAEGLEKVREQLEGLKKPETVGYIPLGYDEGTHFFYDLQSRNIKKTSNFSEHAMFELMPIEYWEMTYPSKKGIDWSHACSDIIQASKRAGPFDSLRVRGTGVWLDNGRTVINTGEEIIHSGKAVDISSFKTHYIYVQTKNRMPPIHEKPLTNSETKLLLDACDELKWDDKRSSYFLAGWIAIARIAGALPIRPHVWLTGGSGTGKSTVMDRVVRPALGSEAARLYLQGGTTEAGVRQSVRADSLPIIFDEFETTTAATLDRTQNLIELLRQSWSHTYGHVVKGSANGVAAHYSLSFSALVSSIRISLNNDADRSRFTILTLAPHGSDQLHWRRIESLLKAIDEEYGERLFARMINMLPTLLESYNTLSRALAGVVNQRFGQQYGMLLAGWYSLLVDCAISEHTAKELVAELDFSESKLETDEETDELGALNFLLSSHVTVQDSYGNRKTATIGRIITEGNSTHLRELVNYGILVEHDTISVANSHAALKKAVFAHTRWAENWSYSLERITGAKKDRKRIGTPNAIRCTSIPCSKIEPALAHGTALAQVLAHPNT